MQTFVVTRCSYCKCIGHDIRNCNHPTIDYNLNLIREKHATYYYNRSESPIARALFVNYLYYSFNLDQIRSVVVRLRIGNASVSKSRGIELISNHLNIQNRLVNIEQEPQNDTVTWSIDRTPDAITINTNMTETRVSSHTPNIVYDLIEEIWDPFVRYTPSDNTIYSRINNFTPQIHYIIKMKLLNETPEKKEQIEKTFDCPICLECIHDKNSVKLNCYHVFCETCIGEVVKTNTNNITCALCRVKVTSFEVSSNDVYEKLQVTHGNRIQAC